MKQNFIWMLGVTALCGLICTVFTSVEAADKWVKKADMSSPRFGMSASVVNGRIYLIAGMAVEQGKESYLGVEEYNPNIETWTKKADIPTPRVYLSTSVVDGKIYAIGGFGKNVDLSGLSSTEEYDPNTDKWTKKADMPTPRWSLSTCVVNGRIYALGGFSNKSTATVEEYDPATDKWTRRKDMPVERYSFSSCTVNGIIFAVGGNGINGTSIDEYDPKTDKWWKGASMPTGRYGLQTSVINGKIYAIGGGITKVIGNTFFGEGIDDVEEYDPVRDEWITRMSIPTARYYFAQGVVDGRIYTFGGVKLSQFYLSAVEEYTPESKSFSITLEDKLVTTWAAIKSQRY